MRVWILCCLLALTGPATPAEAGDANTHFFQPKPREFADALAEARRQGKHGVLVMFETETCSYCRRMRSNVLNRAEVQDYFRRHFLIYSMDVRGDLPLIDFRGNATTEKQFAEDNRVRATPVFMFFNLEGEVITRYTGATKTVEDFLLLGRYVAEGAYKRNMPFNEYRKLAQP